MTHTTILRPFQAGWWLLVLSLCGSTAMAQIRIEAEDMNLSGYTLEGGGSEYSDPDNDGFKKIALSSSTGTASITFGQPSGIYDVYVRYLDENDGACTLQVSIGGTVLQTWTQDANTSTGDLIFSRLVGLAIPINNGDTIQFDGTLNAGEKGRIDYIEFIPAAAITRLEAEDFSLSGNYYTEGGDSNWSPNGQGNYKIAVSSGSGTATKTFTGASGTYEVRLKYLDENDGEVDLEVRIAGTLLADWTFNENNGSVDADMHLTRVIHPQLQINNGDLIQFDGTRNDGERGRIDFIEFISSGPSPPAAPTVLNAGATGTTTMSLSWTDNASDEDGFKIERHSGGSFVEVASVAADVTTFDDTGLTAGTAYTYRVLAYNSGGNSAPSNEATATTDENPPAAPNSLNANTTGSTSIQLTWVDASNDETGFRIERHNGGAFAEIATVAAGVTSYDDPGLTPSTSYTYRVFAYNSGGDSPASNESSATTNVAPPAVPSALSADVTGSTTISLGWTDNAGNEDGFKIERHNGGSFVEVGSVAADVVSFDDAGLSPGTAYTYRVLAYNGGGSSAASNEVTATTDQVVPTAPAALNAVATGSSSIQLTWTDASDNEDGFRVERHNGGAFASVTTLAAGSESFEDTGLAESTQYTYRVFAYNSAGDSPASNEDAATTDAAPTSYTLEAESMSLSGAYVVEVRNGTNGWSGDDIKINTGAGDTGAATTTFPFPSGLYKVSMRYMDEDDGLAAMTVDIDGSEVDSWTFSNPSLNDFVTRELVSELAINLGATIEINGTRESGEYARVDYLLFEAVEGIPFAPTGLSVLGVSSDSLLLSWQDNSDDETGFAIERSSDAGVTFNAIDSVAANVQSFHDTGLAPGTTYDYRIYAFNASGNSAASNQAQATTDQVAPAAPTALNATANGSSAIQLSWTDASDNEEGFRVERHNGGAFATVTTVAAGSESFEDTGLAESTQYTYRVFAFNSAGDSPASNEDAATTDTAPTTGGFDNMAAFGEQISILGNYLAATSAVEFNGVPATQFSATDNLITVTVPDGAARGDLNVIIAGDTLTAGSFLPTTGYGAIYNFSQAEDADWLQAYPPSQYVFESQPVNPFSGDAGVKRTNVDQQGWLTANASDLGLAQGYYHVLVRYLDESDGSASLHLEINPQGGNQNQYFQNRETWVLSANDDQLHTGTYDWLYVNAGASLRMIGTNGGANSNEQVRIDYIAFAPSPEPRIDNFTPQSGKPGDQVTVDGAYFEQMVNVFVDGQPAVYDTVSTTQIVLTVPNDAGTGTITVENKAGSTNSSDDFVIGPGIASFQPAFGTFGTRVTITGGNFVNVTDVTLAGISVTDTILATDNQIFFTVPENAVSGKIGVVTSSGSAESTADFYITQVTAVTPASAAAGDQVLISLGGISYHGTPQLIEFNGMPAESWFQAGPTQIYADVPYGATSGPITVRTSMASYKSGSIFVVTDSGLPSLTFELENATTRSTYEVEQNAQFSGGANLNHPGPESIQGWARVYMSQVAGHTPGHYAVFVRYMDENDGVSSGTLSVPGNSQHGSWNFDLNINTLRTLATDPVYLDSDDFITVWGYPDGSEPARLDYVQFRRKYKLTTVLSGGNANTQVNLSPPGGFYEPGTSLTLQAVEDPGNEGWFFTEWQENGSSISTQNPLQISMGGDRTITALFEQPLAVMDPFNPAIAVVGDEITLTGQNLIGVIEVRFNGVSADTFTVDGNAQIRAVIPLNATSGPVTLVKASNSTISGTNLTVLVPDMAVDVPGNSYNFGEVPFSNSATATFTIDNSGDGNLHFSIADPSAAEFQLAPGVSGPKTLAPGNSYSFDVIYQPASGPDSLISISHGDTLFITSNDPDTPNLAIALAGTGVPNTAFWDNAGNGFGITAELPVMININGVQNIDPGNYRLSVFGGVRAREMKVSPLWADDVFTDNYELMTPADLAAFIQTHKHLPGIPSATEVARDGVLAGEMHAALLRKVEELTLHVIRLKKRNAAIQARIDGLSKKLNLENK